MDSKISLPPYSDEGHFTPKTHVAPRPSVWRSLIRTLLMLVAIFSCASTLWTLSDHMESGRSPWSILQKTMFDKTINLFGMAYHLDFYSFNDSILMAPSDSLCWPETQHLPPRSRLGISADEAFALDSLCLPHYVATLGHFMETSGLETNSNARQQMYLTLAHSWVGRLFGASPNSSPLPVPPIVHHPASKSSIYTSWWLMNPGFTLKSALHSGLEEIGRRITGSPSSFMSNPHRHSNSPSAVAASQRNLMIERLSSLFNLGGIYVTENVDCLRPYKDWILWNDIEAGGDGRWAGGRAHHVPSAAAASRAAPSFVVGVQTTVSDSQTNWASKHSRPLSLSDLAFASSPGHPIVLDMIRRIAKSEAEPATALTDSVLQYITIMTEGNVHWTDLRDVPPEGLRFGDLLLLSKDTFETDVGVISTKRSQINRLS
ncbi:uncharacterized protein MELLADRAFT_59347 [Melampsora larici-populina 98AG31]|uniref:Uncharacterized protein n=1 Tax=Melampsora larici-populina (strain 98AG31 / pathotype 3-4-7) TaxID=747676 RepID=F4R5Z4_MELLP|nr:uncharacterized protein MELLADRAFT_59347 [Melampsora larici-populina 98AG31]EGG12126.1 hypothetical protein MELLADRAFT_59347 [Melampsora larici-populina 98AG31]